LQDAVFLQEAIPNWFLGKHPIFHCPEFNAFAVQLKDAVSLSTVPQEERLQPAVPLIENKLRDMSTIMTDHHNSLNAMLNSHKEMHAQFHIIVWLMYLVDGLDFKFFLIPSRNQILKWICVRP